MNKKILGMAMAVGSVTMMATAHASFIIDDFSEDTDYITAPGAETTMLGTSSDFSLSRLLDIVENPSGAGGASFIVTGDVLGISSGIATGSDTKGSYSNVSGFDFSVAESGGTLFDVFVLNLLTIDQGGVDVTLTIDGNSSTQFVNSIGNVIFNHSLFGDVSDVKNIDFFIHNNVAVDATFGSFDSYGNQMQTVPEPASLALLGVGLVAFGAVRRKK